MKEACCGHKFSIFYEFSVIKRNRKINYAAEIKRT